MFDTENWSAIQMIAHVSTMGEHISNYTLSHPNVERLMNSGEHFDAMLVELFVAEPLLGLGKHFKCPVIGVSTFSTSKWTNDLTGNPSMYSFVPHNFLEFGENMDFHQRMVNTLVSQFENVFYTFVHYPRQVKFKKFFKREI